MLSDANLKYAFAGLAVFGLGAIGYTQYQAAEEAEPDVAVMTMGMAPQLPLIRDIADEAGWNVSCEGVSGEMTTLRLSPGFWADDETGEALAEELVSVASSAYPISGGAAEADTCDVAPSETSIEGPEDNVAIAFGLTAELAHYAEVARSCGWAETEIAPISAFYLDMMEPGTVGDDWQALYISLADAERHGPTMCYVIMSSRNEADGG
ncbi:hypothetical protein [Erythrobacter sp. EC-HK427]|uniref:hypothetical protein n=1 Tax=Erythrobacter sp. EC-HK427 TaxID=2038396 RepID=UPI0012567208|nr:hypothetical protein [Erythrobacter sp. EC-HK427]VVT05681.1 hypothetical protein ERY430_41261 [Erythrobacter sp. EC-HK427]